MWYWGCGWRRVPSNGFRRVPSNGFRRVPSNGFRDECHQMASDECGLQVVEERNIWNKRVLQWLRPAKEPDVATRVQLTRGEWKWSQELSGKLNIPKGLLGTSQSGLPPERLLHPDSGVWVWEKRRCGIGGADRDECHQMASDECHQMASDEYHQMASGECHQMASETNAIKWLQTSAIKWLQRRVPSNGFRRVRHTGGRGTQHTE